MEITIRMEAHELPQLLAQLLASIGDPAKLAHGILASQRAAIERAPLPVAPSAAEDEGEPQCHFTAPLITAPRDADLLDEQMPTAMEAEKPKAKRGRKPKQPSAPPGPIVEAAEPETFADAPASINKAPEPASDLLDIDGPGAAPAPVAPRAAVMPTEPVSPRAAPATPASDVSIDDVKQAFQLAAAAALAARRSDEFDAWLPSLLAGYNVRQVRLIPQDKWAEALGRFQAQAKLYAGA